MGTVRSESVDDGEEDREELDDEDEDLEGEELEDDDLEDDDLEDEDEVKDSMSVFSNSSKCSWSSRNRVRKNGIAAAIVLGNVPNDRRRKREIESLESLRALIMARFKATLGGNS